MKAPLEKDIQKTCIAWLRLWGAVVVRVNSAAVKVGDRFFTANDQPGCSDTIVCLPDGGFAAIEFKRPGKKPTNEQRYFLDKIIATGGMGLVIHSLAELLAALRDEGYDTELPK